jgi:hypothetical protein
MSERAVRLKSCRVHPEMPHALSNADLNFENPPIGRSPSVVKTRSTSPTLGILASTACAAVLIGRIKSTFVLFLAAGRAQSVPSISLQRNPAASPPASKRPRTLRPSYDQANHRLESPLRGRAAFSRGAVSWLLEASTPLQKRAFPWLCSVSARDVFMSK